MDTQSLRVSGFRIQQNPPIYVAAVAGSWLLEHSTPSWRVTDPVLGFQRVVREERARQIALAVLDQNRTFPNAIVLASDCQELVVSVGQVEIPVATRFLVVDGQHRLWAQRYSQHQADYACVIHTGLTEVEMARLFLEINDNQKRVPSSLRWDLVRLVRPDDDPVSIATAEMVYILATDEQSPLFQRIDLTGEQPELYLKQGSIAPELQRLLGSRSSLGGLSFDQQLQLVTRYLIAVKDAAGDGWGTRNTPFYTARVLRALLRLLPDIAKDCQGSSDSLTSRDFLPYLNRINQSGLSPDLIRASQGSAGIRAIYDLVRSQALGSGVGA